MILLDPLGSRHQNLSCHYQQAQCEDLMLLCFKLFILLPVAVQQLLSLVHDENIMYAFTYINTIASLTPTTTLIKTL